MGERDWVRDVDEQAVLDSERYAAFVQRIADHPVMADRRRRAVKIGLFYAAIVAGAVALIVTRLVTIDGINEGIKRDNTSCGVRIQNIAGTQEFRDNYRDDLQDLASYFRDLGNPRAGRELDAKAMEVEDPAPADCNPEQDPEGFFG